MNKQVFFTSDWHLGHANSIKFDNRPYANLEEMHEALIRNYNKVVPENGLCYFLGDIVVCNTELAKSIISRLNGTKVIIKGNHDKGSQSLYNCGFDVVLNNAMIMIEGHHVTMSHCPLRGVYREATEGMNNATGKENWHGEDRNPDFSIENYGQFHIQGHIHSPNGGKSERTLGRQFDVGVPGNNYTPVHINEIARWVHNTLRKEKEKGALTNE